MLTVKEFLTQLAYVYLIIGTRYRSLPLKELILARELRSITSEYQEEKNTGKTELTLHLR